MNFEEFLTEAAKAHDPHAAFRKEANAHLSSHSGGSAPHYLEGSDKVNKSFKGKEKEWVHSASADHHREAIEGGHGTRPVSKEKRHEMNSKKMHGLHDIAKKHGFVKPDKPNHDGHYVHPESGAHLHIHKTDTTHHTDAHAGYMLKHGLKKD